ncbi:uncharacterized protein EDB93DRAFT_1110654 [Suillus bovinus]|uniref:uncharacterized protein n=1 Tax=Suillus bovinus TaxID=48563 RepID=UPI001B8816D6|nr:uncharacterized protein EDB93DRAFT_1110654 [Suillus bovinus]KAG2124395.1 hypothetical protein EDB93DRAFT_1110654 [Suillus bovinus]
MFNFAKKRPAEDSTSTSGALKRCKYEIESDETPHVNDEGEGTPNRRSPSEMSTIEPYIQELQEMLDHAERQVHDLKREREQILEEHGIEVDGYRDRIADLEDEVSYQQVTIDVMSDDVDRLERETQEQRNDIEELMEREHGTTVARNEGIRLLKDIITGLADSADL